MLTLRIWGIGYSSRQYRPYCTILCATWRREHAGAGVRAAQPQQSGIPPPCRAGSGARIPNLPRGGKFPVFVTDKGEKKEQI